MAFGPADTAVSRTTSIEERAVEVILRRIPGKRGVELDIVVVFERAGRRIQRRLTDEQVDALWNGTTPRPFKTWILQQIIPQAR